MNAWHCQAIFIWRLYTGMSRYSEFCRAKETEAEVRDFIETCVRHDFNPLLSIDFLAECPEAMDEVMEEALADQMPTLPSAWSGLKRGVGNFGNKFSHWWKRSSLEDAARDVNKIADPQQRAAAMAQLTQKRAELDKERQNNTGFWSGVGQGYNQRRGELAQDRLRNLLGGQPAPAAAATATTPLGVPPGSTGSPVIRPTPPFPTLGSPGMTPTAATPTPGSPSPTPVSPPSAGNANPPAGPAPTAPPGNTPGAAQATTPRTAAPRASGPADINGMYKVMQRFFLNQGYGIAQIRSFVAAMKNVVDGTVPGQMTIPRNPPPVPPAPPVAPPVPTPRGRQKPTAPPTKPGRPRKKP